MDSLIGRLFLSKVWEKIVSSAKGFSYAGWWLERCGEQCVAVKAIPSGCQQLATEPTAILPSVAGHFWLREGFKVILNVRVHNETTFDLEQRCAPDVTLEGRKLRSLQRLHNFLEESLGSSSHSQEKRNESEFASGIQDLVEPLPQITASKVLPIYFENNYLGDYLDTLLELVMKFRTTLHITFSTPDGSVSLLQIAIQRHKVALAKLAVVMELRSLCRATVVAKLMKCADMREVVILLLAIRGNLQFEPNVFTNTYYWRDVSHSCHKNRKSPGEWNLTAKVHGLLVPKWHSKSTAQVLNLQVTLQPVVTGACSMAIGVRNVRVKIENASLHSSQSNVVGFFLSHITVSIRPEVEGQQVLSMLLELPSPNEPYDISATRSISVSATATGSKNPGVAVTAAESSSTTIKSTTTDWRHEHTTGDEVTGNFNSTLGRLTGVRFHYAQPKCPKVSTRFFLKRRHIKSMLDAPFNSDGSVTFNEQCLKTIRWTLAHELAGTDVAWSVSVTVHVTMLDRSTGEGDTLEFWFPHHFLHNMSTDVECTHS
ncbi:hypothetical protein BDL97_10G112900 [Sphagnum fallax]|nr:hypothetical protein BDL97_10G112900 [Sphagnum fallax]